MTASVPVKAIARGVTVATAMFAGLGTAAALWENLLFMRMTPTGGFEITLLLLQSALAGVYVGLPTQCGMRTAGIGGAVLTDKLKNACGGFKYLGNVGNPYRIFSDRWVRNLKRFFLWIEGDAHLYRFVILGEDFGAKERSHERGYSLLAVD